MPLPLNTLNAQQAFDAFSQRGQNVQNLAKIVQATPVGSNMVASLLAHAIDLDAYVSSVNADAALTSSLVAYVQQVTGSTTVGADFSASSAALSALIAAIKADYPKDSAAHVLDRVMDASGNITSITFAATQLPNTLPAIANWLATLG